MLIDEVITRLKSEVPDLRSVEGAAEFQQLVDGRVQPQHGLAAYVMPMGMRGETPLDASGEFMQPVSEVVGVVLMMSSTDALGQRATQRLSLFLSEVIEAVAGWGPSGALGVFQLLRAQMVSVQGGFLTYQIDFSIPTQLRIQP